MGELIHVSRVRIVKDKGPLRRAWIENFPDPVVYGVHGGIRSSTASSRNRRRRRRSTTSWPPSAAE